MAGLSVFEAVQQVTGLHPDLRWPNDVVIGGKKFCGILTEMNSEATRVRYVVIGIGINVNHSSFSGELAPIATSLRMEAGREWSRVALTVALLKSLDNAYRKLIADPAETRTAIIRDFEQRSSYARGRDVRIEEEPGFHGISEGLDERGFLRVRTATGVRTVLSGMVRAVDEK
jgi:BirA family biotin operon repressor/biotin-[acetyl-CoA-carboxylase] ligase